MNYVLPVVLGVLGIALTVTGYLGLRGLLRPNRFVGIRTQASLRSSESFATANRVAGLPTMVAGLIAVVTCLISLVSVTESTTLNVIVISLIGLVGSLAIAAYGGTLGHRAALTVAQPAGCATCACGTTDGAGCDVLRKLAAT